MPIAHGLVHCSTFLATATLSMAAVSREIAAMAVGGGEGGAPTTSQWHVHKQMQCGIARYGHGRYKVWSHAEHFVLLGCHDILLQSGLQSLVSCVRGGPPQCAPCNCAHTSPEDPCPLVISTPVGDLLCILQLSGPRHVTLACLARARMRQPYLPPITCLLHLPLLPRAALPFGCSSAPESNWSA